MQEGLACSGAGWLGGELSGRPRSVNQLVCVSQQLVAFVQHIGIGQRCQLIQAGTQLSLPLLPQLLPLQQHRQPALGGGQQHAARQLAVCQRGAHGRQAGGRHLDVPVEGLHK